MSKKKKKNQSVHDGRKAAFNFHNYAQTPARNEEVTFDTSVVQQQQFEKP